MVSKRCVVANSSKYQHTLNALLSPAAEAGQMDAQNNLGCMYRDGKGVEANPVKAVEWYQKGVLSRILQNINTHSTRFFRQPLKQDRWMLNIILDVCIEMEKESKRIRSRRLNGYKKV